jgi:hypothetical protein
MRQLPISNCNECRFGTVFTAKDNISQIFVCFKKLKIIQELKFVEAFVDIPDWCPLESFDPEHSQCRCKQETE